MKPPRVYGGRCHKCHCFFVRPRGDLAYCSDLCRDAYRFGLLEEATVGPLARGINELLAKVLS